MFQVLNEYDKTIPQIVDEALSQKEAQWKAALNEVVSNSQLELKSLQDQLLLSQRQLDAANVPLSLSLLTRSSPSAPRSSRRAKPNSTPSRKTSSWRSSASRSRSAPSPHFSP